MKFSRKNLTASSDTNARLAQLERTMLASIALMKRLRRENRRGSGSLAAKRSAHAEADSTERSQTSK
jgi:hypothetical protein